MEGTVRKQNGFTLLEVLIAVGVLFIIGSAVLSLSNTLIQGTVGTADATVTNLWAAEGLELVAKNRDDRAKSGNNPVWLEQAEAYSDYGWYTVELSGNQAVLTKATINSSDNVLNITKEQAFAADNDNLLTSEGLTARRLICIEAVGVSSVNVGTNEDRLRCNMDRTTNGRYNDGNRTIGANCSPNDLYCLMTADSLNRNNSRRVIIPSGSAVKVRAVLVWQNQYGYQTSELGTILTNWRSVGN
jgi:prepilin-type N-terminal cleavage/methylation domain-containing protein